MKPYWMTPDHPDWPVVKCHGDEDRTRHELAPETDIRNILSRYGPLGAFPHLSSAPQFGLQDFDSDPTLEFQRLHQARDVYLASEALSAVYPSWESARDALVAGKLVYREGELFVVESEAPKSGASEAATGQAEGAAAEGGA